jgi:redox-sensing transcriptional repressor
MGNRPAIKTSGASPGGVTDKVRSKTVPADSIPTIVVARLPVYLRTLRSLASEGQEITSSSELGARLGLTPAQIRKDLSYFGEFGKQGLGYNVEYLVDQLRQILHVDRVWPVVLVGAGDLGRALAHYHGFHDRGFEIRMVFDADPAKVGKPLARFTILPMDNLVRDIRQAGIYIAMLAVPASVAPEIAERLVQADIRAILNYAPTSLTVPARVQVQNIDPASHLQRMSFYLGDLAGEA